MTKEQIASVFWPELDDPAKLKIRFKNELYRLRRAVGGEAILFADDCYGFNHAVDYEYDVESFENFIAQANLTDDNELKIELLDKAVKQVGGRFLEDVDSTWVWTERERLSQLFLSTLLELAELG